MQYENQIICGNNVEVLQTFPDECIDLTVTSPPYDNLRIYKGFTFDFEALARQLYRVTKPGGVIVWVVVDATIKGSETGTSFRQALYFKDIGFNLHDTMIYLKVNTGGARGSRKAYWQNFEYMFVFTKGGINTFNLIKDRKNIIYGISKSTGGRKRDGTLINKKINLSEFGIRVNTWLISSAQKFDFDHPAPFPEKLANDHIISWSNEGDTILDPFCGSGTTLKMAKINKRKYIGIDIAEEYCELSRQRVDLDREFRQISDGIETLTTQNFNDIIL